MRLNYSDDEDFPGQFNIWQANCNRSLQGKRGQAALKRLRAALLAMPAKRLIRESLSEIVENRVEVCALGAVAMMEQLDDVLYADLDPEDAGIKMGFPRLVAWKIVEQNDIQIEGHYLSHEGPEYRNQHGMPTKPLPMTWQEYTPEERYEKMLAWVEAQIKPLESST